jgi:AraC-like DNA-binding protein
MTKYKEKKTILKPVTAGFRIDNDLPVIPIELNVQDAVSASAHSHPRGQLIYASHGIVRIVTTLGTWLVPPTQAIWIPPNLQHDVIFPGKVTLYSLFMSETACKRLPKICTVLKITALIREMIMRASEWGDQYQPQDQGYRFMQVLIDELSLADATLIDIPSVQDPRLLRVTELLTYRPNANLNQNELAALACVSPRTLARLFFNEAGMTLGEWNRRLLVHHALDRLTKGKTVTAVALDLGYGNTTSFVAMFKKILGISPRRYMNLAQTHMRTNN